MDIDTTVKLIYALGITGSVVAVSFFIIRLLIKVTNRVEELERTTENIGEITERVNEQMDTVESVVSGVKNISDNILQPLSAIAGITKYAKDIINSFSAGKVETTEDASEEE